MPAASSRWPRAPTILRSTGSSRTCAAIIPLDGFPCAGTACAHGAHHEPSTVHVDRDFDAVIDGCAEPKAGRARTWINAASARIYRALCSSAAIAIPSRSMTARAGRRPLRRVARPRLFRREHVPPRARCLEDRAGAPGRAPERRRLSAARHAIRHRPPEDLRRGRGAQAAISPAARGSARRRSGFRRAADSIAR